MLHTLLGLYLDTHIIGHTSYNMLSITKKILLQKNLQNCVTNNVFLDKKETTTTTIQKIIKHKKTLPEPGLETGTSRTQSGCVSSAPPSQLRILPFWFEMALMHIP